MKNKKTPKEGVQGVTIGGHVGTVNPHPMMYSRDLEIWQKIGEITDPPVVISHLITDQGVQVGTDLQMVDPRIGVSPNFYLFISSF